jgi:M6 family metalloprotease-like protein
MARSRSGTNRVGKLLALLVLILTSLWGAIPGSFAAAQEVERSGWFYVIWVDPPFGPRVAPPPLYVLSDGVRWTRIVLDERLAAPLGGPLALNRKRVRLSGSLVRIPHEHLQARAIRFEDAREAAAPDPVTGPQPWVTILCRFGDSPGVTPRERAWFEPLVLAGQPYPGLDHFWQEVSYNLVNLAGSAVVGWYNLPQPRSYYVSDDINLMLGRLVTDCTAVADGDVYFPDFVGINLMFNESLHDYYIGFGGGWTLNRDGQTRRYRVTWNSPQCFQFHGCLAHEMGHGFGLPHSSGPYDATYDSGWDVMSGPGWNCPPYHPTYGCLGVHTISYHKDRLFWMGTRKFVPGLGFRGAVYLERLALPPTSTNYLMVHLPIDGVATRFYTIEARRRVGYDGQVPGDAVILHLVDTTRRDRLAQVVDVDGNGNPRDAGAMWTVGETFHDKAVGRGVRVRVLSADANGFNVAVAYGHDNDTPGLYNPTTSTFFLRNSNTAGVADLTFPYGPPGAGWIPLLGDWDGDGVDTVGLYNPATSTFYLRNSNTAGVADITFQYGPAGAGWIPVVGDWNGDGVDTVGLYNPATSTFYLRNSNTAGVADLTFGYGPPGAGWRPVVGDWDRNGTITVGLYNSTTSVYYLRNSNTAGVADVTFGYGPAGAGWIPGTGDWDGT